MTEQEAITTIKLNLHCHRTGIKDCDMRCAKCKYHVYLQDIHQAVRVLIRTHKLSKETAQELRRHKVPKDFMLERAIKEVGA